MAAVVFGSGPGNIRAQAGNGSPADGDPGSRFQASSLLNIGNLPCPLAGGSLASSNSPGTSAV
jgi:hypothetical protein